MVRTLLVVVMSGDDDDPSALREPRHESVLTAQHQDSLATIHPGGGAPGEPVQYGELRPSFLACLGGGLDGAVLQLGRLAGSISRCASKVIASAIGLPVCVLSRPRRVCLHRSAAGGASSL
jgi:hypothetical protein